MLKRRLGLLLGGMGLFSLSNISCDNTVSLDTTLPSLTDIYVSNVCPNPTEDDNLRTLDLSVVLLNPDAKNLLPDSRVKKEFQTVGELLKARSFTFNLPSNSANVAPGVSTQAFASPDLSVYGAV